MIYNIVKKKSDFYESLIVRKHILEKIRNLENMNNIYTYDNIIGVHFRKYNPSHDSICPDLVFDINSPIEMFIESMKKHSSYKRFLVATTDKTFVTKLEDHFDRDRLIILNENATTDRDTIEGMVNNLVDFLTLSKCEYIIGTYFSSFSDESSFFNLIPKECIIRQEYAKDYYHCYGLTNINNKRILNRRL